MRQSACGACGLRTTCASQSLGIVLAYILSMRGQSTTPTKQLVCTPARPHKKKTILVAEDNKDFRDLMCIVLRRDGYDVCEAENGQEALDKLDRMNQPPCLL